MEEAAVSWFARQQEVVALSLTEAEFIGTYAGVKEPVWVRRLVKNFGPLAIITGVALVFVDIQESMELAKVASVSRRT